MTRLTAIAISFALLVPALGSAKTYSDEKAKVQVDIPDTWRVQASPEMLAAQSPDENVGLLFMTMPADAMEKALEELDKELNKMIKNLKAKGEPEEVTINGMKGISLDGTGTIEGEKVEMGVMVLQAPSGKIVMVMGFSKAAAWKRYEGTLADIFKSLKPTK